MNNKKFNIVIVGTGGQGLITLLQILAEAALIEKLDVKTSELHGLSQRGGSVEVHLRFGKKINSPLVAQASADLILALETQESLKARYYANSKTIFLLNDFSIPILQQKVFKTQEIIKELKKISKNIIAIPAADICEKKLGKNVVAGIYLLTYASCKNLIPLKPNTILKAIKKAVNPKYFELNKKAFNLAKSQLAKK